MNGGESGLEAKELDLGVELWPAVRWRVGWRWGGLAGGGDEEKGKQAGNFTYGVHKVTVTTCTANKTQIYVSQIWTDQATKHELIALY
jgi:hypothetical protein